MRAKREREPRREIEKRREREGLPTAATLLSGAAVCECNGVEFE